MNTELTKTRGGARKGAGAPKKSPELKRKSRTITMDDARWLKFKELGGTKWLNDAIDGASAPSPS